MSRKLFIIFFLLFANLAFSQIAFDNPSFEGEPQDATVPAGWIACEPLTTPDILPGFWGVYNEASEGETFIGLITRSNGTFESFGQRVKETLSPKICYAFTLDLAHSRTYAGYNGQIKLKVWGGKRKCGKEQLLYDSGAIKNSNFKTHQVKFTPKSKIKYILFEAFFDDQASQKPYNGNLLMDNLSLIVPCKRV